MDVVKIFDGLGNQMFQYAFARKLQINKGREVYLDTRFINNEDGIVHNENLNSRSKFDLRSYELDKFKIKLPVADNDILKHWQYLSKSGSFSHEVYKLAKIGLWPYKYSNERFTKICMDSILPTYYRGHFFKLSYYDDIKTILQKEFVLKEKIRLPAALKKILNNDNTVSIHVRRGDYVKLHKEISNKVYYPKALELMAQKVDKPTWLFFSDDIEWVKKYFKTDGKTVYVSDMGFQDYEELMIMKHCKHHIITNSTFSYWGAYLNPNPDKVIVCPKIWQADVIPEEWIRL